MLPAHRTASFHSRTMRHSVPACSVAFHAPITFQPRPRTARRSTSAEVTGCGLPAKFPTPVSTPCATPLHFGQTRKPCATPFHAPITFQPKKHPCFQGAETNQTCGQELWTVYSAGMVNPDSAGRSLMTKLGALRPRLTTRHPPCSRIFLFFKISIVHLASSE